MGGECPLRPPRDLRPWRYDQKFISRYFFKLNRFQGIYYFHAWPGVNHIFYWLTTVSHCTHKQRVFFGAHANRLEHSHRSLPPVFAQLQRYVKFIKLEAFVSFNITFLIQLFNPITLYSWNSFHNWSWISQRALMENRPWFSMLYFGKQYSGNSQKTQIFFQTNLDLEIETVENHIA